MLPAGEYDFTVDALGAAIRVVSDNKGPSSDALVLTRIGGEIHTTLDDSHIVFDTIGDKCTFSEFWIPGSDGYVVNATKEKHTHKTIKVHYKK